MRAGGGSKAAWAAIVFGVLALASIPAGTIAVGRFVSVDLARATSFAVAACFVFGLAGVSAVRRARYRNELSLYPGRTRMLRVGRFLVYAGLYVGLIGVIALAFYGVVLASS
jgi:hypothetical protein